jgi:hypothetical protein
VKLGDFPVGSLKSRAMARIRAQQKWHGRKRIEFITNVRFHQDELPQATDNSIPYAYPWQETSDGGLMRFVYSPGEWKQLPVETMPVCSGCGAPFRQQERALSGWVWLEADCMARHISDGST